MVGKGSVNHNSRKFHAKNTDPERSNLNMEYCNENIKEVYHQLFDEALVRYNDKQTRSDRRIDDYYEKNLRVFSAHLHMDEATPHFHIDFVPYSTGSKRGLDSRVSLKQALAAFGFQGGTRSDTEWNQWVAAEKRQLASIMQIVAAVKNMILILCVRNG